MNDVKPTDLVIADFQISEISDAELENAFHRVVMEHKDAVKSIHDSMDTAAAVYKKYLNPNFVPEEKIAKDDRAELNKAEKNIAEKFAALKEAYEKPLRPTETEVKTIRNAIKEAAGVVDRSVKAYKELQDKKKRQEVTDYFLTKKFDLVPLERIWNEKWLNKGMKMPDISKEIDEAIAKIYGDIQVLERIPEHGMTAKAMYLRTLDMSAALHEVDALKENAERLAREELNRQNRQMQEQCDRNASNERQEQGEQEIQQFLDSKVDEAVGFPTGTTAAETREEVIEYTMTFKGTKEQLLKLRQFMSDNGIPYKKGLLLENSDHAAQIMQQKKLAGRIYSFIYVPAA